MLPSNLPPVIAFDIETNPARKDRINPRRDKIVLITLGFPDGQTFAIRDHFEQVAPLVNNPRIKKIVHNAEFDFRFMLKLGMQPRNVWDTFVIERVLTVGTKQKCALDAVMNRYFKLQMDKGTRDRFVEGKPLDKEMIDYALSDIKYLIQLYEAQKQKVSEFGLEKVAELENLVVPVVADMEWRGVAFDVAAWELVKADERRLLREAYDRILKHFPDLQVQFSMLDDDVLNVDALNPSSPRLLKKLREIGIELPNTSKETLQEYAENHVGAAVLDDVLAYRSSQTALGFAYEEYIDADTGRIHARFNQMGTDTARFSGSDPNLQQVKREAIWRRMFVAGQNRLLATSDYNQLQLRLIAEVAQCKNMISAFAEHRDLHIETAQAAYGEQVSEEQRQHGKTTNFARVFGASPEKISRTARIPLKLSQKIVDAFDLRYPEIEVFGEKCFKALCETGYSEDYIGRKRWFPELTPTVYTRGLKRTKPYSAYQNRARNTPIQELESSVVKLALVECWKEGFQPVLQVHDEIVNEIDDPASGKEIGEIMVEAGKKYLQYVPLEVKFKVDERWIK